MAVYQPAPDPASPTSITEAALDVGLRPRELRTFAPCPACMHDTVHRGSRRGPVEVDEADARFRCVRCGAAGDAGLLVELARTVGKVA